MPCLFFVKSTVEPFQVKNGSSSREVKSEKKRNKKCSGGSQNVCITAPAPFKSYIGYKGPYYHDSFHYYFVGHEIYTQMYATMCSAPT